MIIHARPPIYRILSVIFLSFVFSFLSHLAFASIPGINTPNQQTELVIAVQGDQGITLSEPSGTVAGTTVPDATVAGNLTVNKSETVVGDVNAANAAVTGTITVAGQVATGSTIATANALNLINCQTGQALTVTTGGVFSCVSASGSSTGGYGGSYVTETLLPQNEVYCTTGNPYTGNACSCPSQFSPALTSSNPSSYPVSSGKASQAVVYKTYACQ